MVSKNTGKNSKTNELISAKQIEASILIIRNEKVILDRNLAKLYGVENRVLGQAIRRNIKRFPEDFMFQLTQEEFEDWKSQFVTSNSGDKMGLRKRPYVFTEHGVAMLSSVLHSNQAIEVNIAIMRTFTKFRRLISNNKELASKLEELERRYDKQFRVVFDAIRKLMKQEDLLSKQKIGFNRN